MINNLSKRIITSIILSTLFLLCFFLHKYTWLILLIIASIICFFEFNNLAKKILRKKKTSIDFANLIIFFYLIFFTYTAFELAKYNIENVLYVLLVCIFSDIGGYVIGRSVGGKKLTKISPNKTISGTIGSFSFSLIPMILFSIIYYKSMTPSVTEIFFITLILSFICQSGDLFISYFKRKAKVKDTGTILPGHGGLLDRIDGIIFAVPAFFIIEKIFY